MCMGMGFPFPCYSHGIPMGIPWEWNTNMPKMGMGMGRVRVTMGMGMATFSCVRKFPSIGRLDANAICDFRLRIADISLQFINDLDWTTRSACSKLRKQTGLSCVRTNDAYCATGPLYSFTLQRLLPPRNCFVTMRSSIACTLYSSRLLSVQHGLDQITGNRLLSTGSRIYRLP